MEHFRGCLRSYSGHVGLFPSKADQIMSRYRPIAPKPTLPCASEADKSASSAITFDNLCIRQVPDAPPFSKQKNKRVRKRPSKDSDTQEPTKKLATGNVLNLAEKGLSQGLAAEVAQLNIPEDVGFMERAAASVPSSVFPLEKAKKSVTNNSYGYGGCFTEMIRGIAGLPSAAHVHNLLQQQQQQLQEQQEQQSPKFFNVLRKEPAKQQADEAPLQGNAREKRDYAKEELSSDAFWSCFSGESMRECAERGVSEEQQQSGLDEEKSDGEDDGRRRIVTLNLLPEAPTRGDSPTISTCSSSSKGFLSSGGNSLLYVELVYGQSSEPVVLVDDLSRAVLWVNQGYVKACKDNFNTPAAFIDPLGIPTQLGQFQVQVDGQSECISATLWGFLKKLVVDLGGGDVPRCMPCHATVPFESVKEAQLPSICSKGRMSQQQYCGGMPINSQSMESMELSDLVSSRVITPQPVRLVGSVVSLESVTEVQTKDITPGTWELAKKQLEEDSLPGFITDTAKVVRWVNTAYKAMVGQPECPWLVSTVKTGGESPTITGEVLLSCNVEVPHLATSFSGRANVQWTRNTGERSCMTVPCDVLSLVDSNARKMLVWRFDIQASLSLTCGVER